jgi:hypothetical protein
MPTIVRPLNEKNEKEFINICRVHFFLLFWISYSIYDSGDRPAFIKYPIICITFGFLFFLLPNRNHVWSSCDVLFQMWIEPEKKTSGNIKENMEDFEHTNKEWF